MYFIHNAKLTNSTIGSCGNSLNRDRDFPIFVFGLLKINLWCNFVA